MQSTAPRPGVGDQPRVPLPANQLRRRQSIPRKGVHADCDLNCFITPFSRFARPLFVIVRSGTIASSTISYQDFLSRTVSVAIRDNAAGFSHGLGWPGPCREDELTAACNERKPVTVRRWIGSIDISSFFCARSRSPLTRSGFMRVGKDVAIVKRAGFFGLRVCCLLMQPGGCGVGPRAIEPKNATGQRTARAGEKDSSGNAGGEYQETAANLYQRRRGDPPGEVPELPPSPPGRAVRPRDLRAGPEAGSRHRRGDRGAVDAALEADPGRGPEAQTRPVADSPSIADPDRLGRGGRRAATPRTCRRRPASPRVGSSGRPT